MEGFSWNLIFEYFSKNCREYSNFQAKVTGTLHEEQCTFMIISCWILLRMRNSQTTVVEKITTHILCSVALFFPRKPCRLWDCLEKYDRDRQATDDSLIRHRPITSPMNKDTNTHSDYAVLLTFPRKHWLSECASLLSLYVCCPSCYELVLCRLADKAVCHDSLWKQIGEKNARLL
jgi:hypothetical protein